LKRLVLILLLFLGIVSQLQAHPVHVSVCNLEFDSKGLTIAVKLFQDDLLLAIQTDYRKEIDRLKIEEEKNLYLLANYVSDNIHIGLNKNENLELNYYKYEINEDAIWLYYRIQGLKTSKKLYITNTLMVELYHDQTNLVILNYMGKQNGYRFNYNTREQDIDLK
jgi:Domain of unknown function (DUF6702)